jgi:hypothetical protein
MVEVAVEANREVADMTVQEMRLPIDHLVDRVDRDHYPNPFEVATVYMSAFTKTTGTWRAQLIVERRENKNGELWMVTVRDEGANIDLVTATAKELDTGVKVGQLHIKGLTREPLPLQRLNLSEGQLQSPNRWELLRLTQLGPDIIEEL